MAGASLLDSDALASGVSGGQGREAQRPEGRAFFGVSGFRQVNLSSSEKKSKASRESNVELLILDSVGKETRDGVELEELENDVIDPEHVPSGEK